VERKHAVDKFAHIPAAIAMSQRNMSILHACFLLF
jgi:hypothetical protein